MHFASLPYHTQLHAHRSLVPCFPDAPVRTWLPSFAITSSSSSKGPSTPASGIPLNEPETLDASSEIDIYPSFLFYSNAQTSRTSTPPHSPILTGPILSPSLHQNFAREELLALPVDAAWKALKSSTLFYAFMPSTMDAVNNCRPPLPTGRSTHLESYVRDPGRRVTSSVAPD